MQGHAPPEPQAPMRTPDEVAELDDRETQFSISSTRIETSEYLAFVVPGSYTLTYVRLFRSDPNRAESVIDEVLDRIRKSGGTGLRWVVNSRSLPNNLAKRLMIRGFSKVAAAETLFFELGSKEAPRLPRMRAAETVRAREVFTDAEIELFVRLGTVALGEPRPPPSFLERFRLEVREYIERTGHSELFLSYDGGVPVGRGGLTVTGIVGRLWTAGVLLEHRRKGAYLALTRERCKSALEQGAEVVLTHAKVDTSGPILKGHGFRSAGPYDYYELRFE
jgi:hypothetical protein